MSTGRPKIDSLVVAAEEAALLLVSLKRFPRAALAVSGGSDSTALMWLAARWARKEPEAPDLTVLTVDHGLRAASASEAETVRTTAGALGLRAVVLKWEGAKPKTGVQAVARETRYRLMTDWCAGNAVPALVTAHTLDDQAETFLMRLARGSGLDGLASIGRMRRGSIDILRPLLGVSRARLRATLVAAGIGWVDDPSNEDERFERIRWRKAIKLLAEEGISAADIARSAARLARARAAIEAATEALVTAAVIVRRECAHIEAEPFDAAPRELQVRLLRQVLERIGGNPPELAAVERAAEWLAHGEGGARTLAGCRLKRGSATIAVTPEGPRRAQSAGIPA